MQICAPNAKTVIATAATVATAGLAGIASASTASADQATDASGHALGSQATLVNGDVVQGRTVSDLKPSADAIPYPLQGTLWEVSATDEAIKGSVIPIVPDLAALTPSGQTYRALYQVATPQGVNPATLAQGQKTSGKVFFDVTGDRPNRVVYRAGGQDLASWVQSQPPQRRSGCAATSRPASGPATTPTPTPAPAAAPVPTAVPVPAGTQQTPAGSPTTPAAAGGQAPAIPGSQGTPLPVNGPVPPPRGVSPAAPAPVNGPAAPAPEASPAAPAPSTARPHPRPRPARRYRPPQAVKQRVRAAQRHLFLRVPQRLRLPLSAKDPEPGRA